MYAEMNGSNWDAWVSRSNFKDLQSTTQRKKIMHKELQKQSENVELEQR